MSIFLIKSFEGVGDNLHGEESGNLHRFESAYFRLSIPVSGSNIGL